MGDAWKRGQCLTDLARIAIVQGEYDRARVLLAENLAFYRAMGDQLYIAWVLYHLARLLFESQSDLIRAAALAEQSLALNREANATSCSVDPLGLVDEPQVAGQDPGPGALVLPSATILFDVEIPRGGPLP